MHAPDAETLSSLWLIFLGGLFSSAHCIGMCGPLVAITEGMNPHGFSFIRQLPLHLGRITTYAFLGVISGTFGFVIKKGGEAAGFLGAASMIGGVLMIVLALGMLGLLPISKGMQAGEGFVKKFADRLISDKPLSRLRLGLYWGFLPCGLVWMWMGAAGGSGTPWGGALVMFIFGLGTIPALLIIGSLSRMITAKHRTWFNRIGAITVILMGIILILRGAARAGWIGVIKIAPGVPLY
jgi:sulfite exporter TauE/SafE